MTERDEALDPRPTRRRAATRDRLLTAAADVFAEKGLSGASMDDIAQAAGFTKGAIYSNFSSKEELFLAVFDARNRQLLADARRSVETTPTADHDQYVTEVLGQVTPLDRQWYLLSTEFTLFALRNPEMANQFNIMKAEYVAEIGLLLSDALSRLGREPTVEPATLVEVIVSVYQGGSGMSLVAHEDPADTRAVLTAVINALSRPVVPSGGARN